MNKKRFITLLVIGVFIMSLTGCKDEIDTDRGGFNYSDYQVSESEQTIEKETSNIVSQTNEEYEVAEKDFKQHKTITVNDFPITLGETKIADLVDFSTKQISDDKYELYSDNDIVGLLTITNDTISGVLLTNKSVSIEYCNITMNDVKSNFEDLGAVTIYADNEQIKNHTWIWKNKSTEETIKYQMAWYKDTLSQIVLSY